MRTKKQRTLNEGTEDCECPLRRQYSDDEEYDDNVLMTDDEDQAGDGMLCCCYDVRCRLPNPAEQDKRGHVIQ